MTYSFSYRYFLVLLGLIALPGCNWFSSSSSLAIVSYDEARDKEFLRGLFRDDWHWLVSEQSTDFSVEHMLNKRSSSRSENDTGNLTIKVGLVDTKPIGFTAYYKKPGFVGHVLFLAVGKEFRGKGYARQLLSYAVDDLKRMGMSSAELAVRLSNTKARSLYESLGFDLAYTSDGFGHLRKYL